MDRPPHKDIIDILVTILYWNNFLVTCRSDNEITIWTLISHGRIKYDYFHQATPIGGIKIVDGKIRLLKPNNLQEQFNNVIILDLADPTSIDKMLNYFGADDFDPETYQYQLTDELKLIKYYQNQLRVISDWTIVYDEDTKYKGQCTVNFKKKTATIYSWGDLTPMPSDYILHKTLYIATKAAISMDLDELLVQDLCKLINQPANI